MLLFASELFECIQPSSLANIVLVKEDKLCYHFLHAMNFSATIKLVIGFETESVDGICCVYVVI